MLPNHTQVLVARMGRMLIKGLVNQMRCSDSSTGFQFFEISSTKIISHLSLCCAWLTTELWQIILMRFVSLRGVSGVRFCALPKQTRISCERGWASMACMCIWKVLFGEIFSAPQMSPQRTKGVNRQNWFCSNKWETLQWHWCSSRRVSVRKQCLRVFFF